MKSKGFTLAEVLAVVVILGVLVTIGTPIYFRISNNSKKNLLDSKLSYIQAQTIKFAEENHIESSTTINALTLVASGYIVVDEYRNINGVDMPFIKNPLNDSDNLACRKVNIIFEANEIDAIVSNDSSCDLQTVNVLENEMGVSLYKLDNSNRVVGSLSYDDDGVSDWTNYNVLVLVNPNYGNMKKATINYNGTTKTIGSDALDRVSINNVINNEVSNTFIIKSENVVNTIINVNVELENEVKMGVINVKIDKEKPTASVQSYGGWQGSELKNASVYVSDGSGSGSSGVYLTNTTTFNRSRATFYSANNNVATITSKNNGTYYLWAVDNVGNISSVFTILTVSNVDTKAPECMYSEYPDYWVNYPVTVNYGCINDSESGCKTLPKNKEYKTDGVHTEDINFQIEDNVGNKNSCVFHIKSIKIDTVKPICSSVTVSPSKPNSNGWYNKDVTIKYGCLKDDTSKSSKVSKCETPYMYDVYDKDQIYKSKKKSWEISDVAKNVAKCSDTIPEIKIDKTSPTLSSASITSTEKYNSIKATVTISGSDNLSGIEKVCVTTSSSSSSCSWKSMNNNSANIELPSKEGSGESLTLYVFIRDNAHNVSKSKKVSYKVYESCSKTKWTYDTDCSEDCGGGTQKRHKIDKYLSGVSCSEQEPVSCNTHECPHDDDDDGGGDGGGDSDDSPGCANGTCWSPCDPSSGSYWCCNGCCCG